MSDDPSRPPVTPTLEAAGALRSPLRPAPPSEPLAAPSVPAAPAPLPAGAPTDPAGVLAALLRKMEQVASQYANGVINRAQFNAIYGHYKEQRAIIERLLERDPDGSAWQQAAAPGHTGFLRDHFEARPLYYAVYTLLSPPRPLMMGGRHDPDFSALEPVLHALFSATARPAAGVARKQLGDNRWLVLALGGQAVTLVVFALEPAAAQIMRVRDLHAEFERANHAALARGTRSLERLVFPQRALVE